MGFCLGVANIIPGVFGGTFLLVFGIYERVFLILNQINKNFVLKCLKLVFSCFMHPVQGASAAGVDASMPESGKIASTVQGYSPEDYLYIAFCGALAISATILPGVSGSLVLILLGTYFDVISAISELKSFHWETFVFLGIFGLGVIFGGLLFARLVSFVLYRCYNATMAFLGGLMIGSLYALWPFKETVLMAQQYVKQAGEIICLDNVAVQTNSNQR